MKLHNRMFAVVLIALAMLSLAACGGAGAPATLGDIPVFPNATALQPGQNPMADTLAKNVQQAGAMGAKLDQKKYYRHSGYPGGFKETPVRVVLERFPERVIERAVRGMVPHTSLGKQQLGHLHVYAGSTHPHAGQVAQSKPAETEGEATS